jgi:transcriptional regulator with XRE-family HTH domain
MEKKRTKVNAVERLREALRNSGQSLFAVARSSGIDYAVLSRFMSAKRGMNLETAARLMEYLGLELRPAKKGA